MADPLRSCFFGTFEGLLATLQNTSILMPHRWDELTYETEGYRVTFRWDCPEVQPIVEQLRLPNFQVVEGPGDAEIQVARDEDRYRLSLNGEAKGSHPLASLPRSLARELQLEVATYAPDAVFVHAGVVRWEDGLIVIPGRSYAGKSSLTLALCEAGAGYYSDEYAIVDSEGLVRPWPRPISLRQSAERDETPAAQLGWRPDFGPAPVRLIVSARYSKGARWEPEQLSPAQAVLELLSNTVSARLEPERALRYLPLLTTGAVCLKGERGEAEETALLLLERLKSLSTT